MILRWCVLSSYRILVLCCPVLADGQVGFNFCTVEQKTIRWTNRMGRDGMGWGDSTVVARLGCASLNSACFCSQKITRTMYSTIRQNSRTTSNTMHQTQTAQQQTNGHCAQAHYRRRFFHNLNEILLKQHGLCAREARRLMRDKKIIIIRSKARIACYEQKATSVQYFIKGRLR